MATNKYYPISRATSNDFVSPKVDYSENREVYEIDFGITPLWESEFNWYWLSAGNSSDAWFGLWDEGEINRRNAEYDKWGLCVRCLQDYEIEE